MEWPRRNCPAFANCARARVSREVESSCLYPDVHVLRRRELANRARSARFLWAQRHSAHWLNSLRWSRSTVGIAVGSVVHEQAPQSSRLFANVRSNRGSPTTWDHRVGFTVAFRRRSFSRLEMAGARTHYHLSDGFPV